MTVNELILKNKHEVRRDSNLMSLYLKYFQEAFNKLPNCAGCSFATDWQKLVSFHSKTQTQKVMKSASKTITIKRIKGDMLWYKKDGKTFRLYDNILNDNFISEYLKNGSKEEILERKKMFNFPVEEPKREVQPIFTESELNIAEKLVEDISNSQPKKRGRKSKK